MGEYFIGGDLRVLSASAIQRQVMGTLKFS